MAAVKLLCTMLALLVLGCRAGAPAAPAPSLIGTSWRAEEIDGRGVLERVESTLTFDGAQRISGQAACNRYFGGLELGEGTIRLKPAGTTRMACAPDVMDQESRFLAALGAATAFRREGGSLLLLDEGGRMRVRLAPRGPGRGAIDPPPGGPAAAATPLIAQAFDCDNGPGFVLARIEGGAGDSDAIDLILSERRHRLPRVRTASGVRYAAGGIAVWTKGQEAMLGLDGRVARCVENRRRSILEDARARGAEFRASGNEPGWSWELLTDRMVFVGAYGAERVTTSRPPRQSGPMTGEAMYVAVTDAHRLTVRIRPGPCFDSMSGDRYASTVEVEPDGKAHRGCGEVLLSP